MKLKLTKVFFGNKRLKDIYVGATKWEVLKYRATKFFKRVLVVSFIIGLCVGSVYGGYQVGKVSKVDFVNAQTIDLSDKHFSEKIEVLKMKVLEELRSCESGGKSANDGLIVFDTNKRASIGQYQFQVQTVIHYYKTLYNSNLSPTEAIKIALDDEKATKLARDIIFGTKNKAGKDWVNCTAKYDLDRKVDLIKQLEN